MQYKIRKLREQFDADVEALPAGAAGAAANDPQQTATSKIFQGVCIFVNGYTVPSHPELKRLMSLHGGRMENYYTRQLVTHIVCTHLPDVKWRELKEAR